MRKLPTVLMASLLAACAPGGDRAGADTAAAAAPTLPAADSVMTLPPAPIDTGVAGARPGTASPVRPPSSGAPTQQPAAASRPAPPSKAPGGSIVIPRSTHDSLKADPPRAP